MDLSPFAYNCEDDRDKNDADESALVHLPFLGFSDTRDPVKEAIVEAHT